MIASGGPVSDLAAGDSSNAIKVILGTGAAGVESGSVTLATNSHYRDGTTGFASTTTVQVQGVVDNYAVSRIEELGGDGRLTRDGQSYVLNLGTTSLHGRDLSADLGLLNAAIGPADVLSATFTGPSGDSEYVNSGFAGVGGIGGQSADEVGSVTLTTAVAGAFTETLVIHPTGSNASGYSGALARQTLTIEGDVVDPAQAKISPNPIDYGIVHVGDSVATALDIANVAAAGAAGLDASIQSKGGDATASGGPVSDLAAGDSSKAITVGLGTGTAGVESGSVTLATDSRLADGSRAFASTTTVQVEGTVDNYAVSQVEKLSGDGQLTQNGTSYVLNLGTTTLDGSDLSADLGLLNAVVGPADILSATFSGPTGALEYVNSGFTGVSGIGAQSADDVGSVTLTTAVAGTFTETLVVQPTGSNASGYSGALPTETVEITGTVVTPTPPTAVLWGDVHAVTWDGLAYNFQAAGEFTAAQSTRAGDSYDIEVRLAPWSAGATVSVMTEIAASVGTHRVTFGLNRSDVVFVDGVGRALAVGQSIDLGAGALTETSSNTFKLTWATGESAQITDNGSYFNLSTTLAPGEGAGSVKGLLGSDSGQANDFQLADGAVIPQPLADSALYGAFADAWRIPAGTRGLFDYGPGETTDNFTDANFPGNTVSLSQLPQNLVDQAKAQVKAAGITDPGLSLDAELDLIVTGNLGALGGSQNAQQSGVTTTQAVITGTLPAPPMAGVTAAATSEVEAASGVTAVAFTAYLTAAASTDTVIDYAVVAPASAISATPPRAAPRSAARCPPEA